MAIPKQREGTDSKGRDNYNTSSSATHYGKGSIRRTSAEEETKYQDGWERIFGNKNKEVDKK